MPSPRLRRVGELIKRELAGYLSADAQSFKPYIITVTEVLPARDLRSATVWVSIYGDKDRRQRCLEQLKDESKTIRHELAARIYLKRVPALLFKLDDSLELAYRIDKTLMSTGHFNFTKMVRNNDDG